MLQFRKLQVFAELKKKEKKKIIILFFLPSVLYAVEKRIFKMIKIEVLYFITIIVRLNLFFYEIWLFFQNSIILFTMLIFC